MAAADGADAAILVPLQVVVGDLHGLNTLEHQPAKIAAMEAIWKTERGVPLVLASARITPSTETRWRTVVSFNVLSRHSARAATSAAGSRRRSWW